MTIAAFPPIECPTRWNGSDIDALTTAATASAIST